MAVVAEDLVERVLAAAEPAERPLRHQSIGLSLGVTNRERAVITEQRSISL
jgi:hypothetical protein